MTLHTNEKPTLAALHALWAKFGDTPTGDSGDKADCLEEPFQHFPIGTHREDVWHWFEAQHPDFIVGDVMQGIRRTDAQVGQAAHG